MCVTYQTTNLIVDIFSFRWWSYVNFFLWFINWLKVHQVSGHIHIKLFFEILEVIKSVIVISLLYQQFHISLFYKNNEMQEIKITCSVCITW